jgi:hypothetical protein
MERRSLVQNGCAAWHKLQWAHHQGGQIGRIFAHPVYAFFEQLCANYKSNPHFWATPFHCEGWALILAKKWIGLHFGRFFLKLIWSPCPPWSFDYLDRRVSLLLPSQLTRPSKFFIIYDSKNGDPYFYPNFLLPRSKLQSSLQNQMTLKYFWAKNGRFT